MAYGVKYELFFSDVERRKLKIEILEKDYTGDPSAIVGTGKPAVIEWDAEDDVYSPIIGSRCKLSFFVTDLVTYDEFYKSDERQYKVKILFYNSFGNNWEDEVGIWNQMDVIWNAELGEEYYYQPIWEGFLVVDRYQEAILTPPYEINLEAIDGLGTLEGFDAPISTETTSNTESLFYYLKEILKLTGQEFDIYIANGIRKATSPPEDETIFHDIIINEYGLFNQNMTLRSAKDVLEQILQITNSRIFQSYGRWYVVSNSNLIDNRIDVSGVIDGIGPSGDDDTDDPDDPTPDPVYSQPDITIDGADPMYEGTAYFLYVRNSGTVPVSYEWTLPDFSTVTTTGPQLSLGVVSVADDDGDVYSVEATDANSQTDTASFTLNVDPRPVVTDPDPPDDETDDTNYSFVINVVNAVSGAYVSPLKGTIDYPAGDVGTAFTMQFDVVSLSGEFTSASQLTDADLTTTSGTYNVATALVGDFIRVTVTGDLPSGGGTETLTLTGASDVQQFTVQWTVASSVSNASYSLSPTDMTVTGGTGKKYLMTITYNVQAFYKFNGPQDISIRASKDIGQTITVTRPIPGKLIVAVKGNIGIQDESETLTITGAAIYAADGTFVTLDKTSPQDISSGGGYFDLGVTTNGAVEVAAVCNWIELSPLTATGRCIIDPSTTSLRLYFEPNNTNSSRRCSIIFYALGSGNQLASFLVDQESNVQAGATS